MDSEQEKLQSKTEPPDTPLKELSTDLQQESSTSHTNEEKDDGVAVLPAQSDNCPICLAPMTEEARLDLCDHKFCRSCIVEWIKVKDSCPLCKAKATFIETDGEFGKERQYIHSIIREVERERIVATARQSSLEPERAALLYALRAIRSKIGHLKRNNAESSMKYRMLVSDRTSLQALKDDFDNFTRGELVADMRFRRVIYELILTWSPIIRPATNRRFTPATALSEIDSLRVRVRPFILRDLPLIINAETGSYSSIERMAEKVLTLITNCPINSPMFLAAMKSCDLPLRDALAVKFCDLLYELCASGLDMAAFDENSSFALPNNRRSTRSNDDGPIFLESDEAEADDDVISVDGELDDSVIPVGEIRRVPAFEGASPSSSSDGISELYSSRHLRMPRPSYRPYSMLDTRYSSSRRDQLLNRHHLGLRSSGRNGRDVSRLNFMSGYPAPLVFPHFHSQAIPPFSSLSSLTDPVLPWLPSQQGTSRSESFPERTATQSDSSNGSDRRKKKETESLYLNTRVDSRKNSLKYYLDKLQDNAASASSTKRTLKELDEFQSRLKTLRKEIARKGRSTEGGSEESSLVVLDSVEDHVDPAIHQIE